MTPIELPIFHHTDETSTFKEVGINYDIEDAEIRIMTFFVINAISPYVENDNQYSSIHSNGSEYICNMPYKELIKLIST